MIPFALVAVAFFTQTPAGSAPPAPSLETTVTVEKGIGHATAGGEKLLLDIAIPPGKGPFPCIVCFHGGASVGRKPQGPIGQLQGQER